MRVWINGPRAVIGDTDAFAALAHRVPRSSQAMSSVAVLNRDVGRRLAGVAARTHRG